MDETAFDGAEEAIAIGLSAGPVSAALEPIDDTPPPPTLEQVLAARRPVEARTPPTRRNPDGFRYVVGPHRGPNHQMRRAARLMQERQHRRYLSWRAQLQRVGIDPDAVIAARQARWEKAHEQHRDLHPPDGAAERAAGSDPAHVPGGSDDAQLAS